MLISLMKKNFEVGRGKYSSKESGKKHKAVWNQVSMELNSLSGANKTAQQWKRCWIDWKALVKKQYGKIISFQNRTGNHPKETNEGPKPLDALDYELVEFFRESFFEGVNEGLDIFMDAQLSQSASSSIEDTVDALASTSRAGTMDSEAAVSISSAETVNSASAATKTFAKEENIKTNKLLEKQIELLGNILSELKEIKKKVIT